jgi:hypothetical protein
MKWIADNYDIPMAGAALLVLYIWTGDLFVVTASAIVGSFTLWALRYVRS